MRHKQMNLSTLKHMSTTVSCLLRPSWINTTGLFQNSSAQPPLSFDRGLGTETSQAELNCKVIHQKRVDISLLSKAERKPKINFPVSCDPIWNNVNNELEQIIPTVFPEKLIKSLSTSDLSLKFDSWLYQFFLDQFGKQEQKSNRTKRAFCPNKQLEFLRIQKKQCKAAHKALVKAGLTGTEEEQIILKQWHSLLRQHNKLGLSLLKKQEQRNKIAAEKSFKNDPNKFSQSIFHPPTQNAQPEFSAEAAEQYFQKHTRILIETTFTLLSQKCLAQIFQPLYFQHTARPLLNCRKVLKENAMGQHQG